MENEKHISLPISNQQLQTKSVSSGSTEDLSQRSLNNSRESFVPIFPSNPSDKALLRPSDYAKKTGPARSNSISESSITGSSNSGLPVIPESREEVKIPQPPPAPPIPSLPLTNGLSNINSNNQSFASKISTVNPSMNRRGKQMPTISVDDLKSVHLKKTERVSKTNSVPLSFG